MKIVETVKSDKLPLNLQFFAEGEDGGNAGNEETGKPEDGAAGGNSNNPGNTDNAPDPSKDGGGEVEKKNNNAFTQTDVNNLIAKETKKAQEKLLRQLGVKDIKDAKSALDEYKQQQEDQKSDTQKAIDKANELEKTNGNLSDTVSTLNAKIAALSNDTNPDSVDDVIVLAKQQVDDNTDIDTAVKNVLEKYPHFKRVEEVKDEVSKKPKFSEGEHKIESGDSDKDKWINAFKFN